MLHCSLFYEKCQGANGAGERNRTAFSTLARLHNNRYTTPAYVPRVRIELTTPAFSELCSTTELPRPVWNVRNCKSNFYVPATFKFAEQIYYVVDGIGFEPITPAM